MAAETTAAGTLRDIAWPDYDFIDLGCSSGRSVGYSARRFGGQRGIGVDLDEAKVARAAADGVEAVHGDATQLDLDRQVRFISMLDFLEHLPDLDTVERVLRSAASAATDFLFIKHPSFEGRERVEAQGVRQYWWDWHGHTAQVRIADYCLMFERLGLLQYHVRYLTAIEDSDHDSIIPTSMPQDRSAEEARETRPEPYVRFVPPIWRRQDIFVALRAFEPEEWAALVQPTRADMKLMGLLPQRPPPAAASVT